MGPTGEFGGRGNYRYWALLLVGLALIISSGLSLGWAKAWPQLLTTAGALVAGTALVVLLIDAPRFRGRMKDWRQARQAVLRNAVKLIYSFVVALPAGRCGTSHR